MIVFLKSFSLLLAVMSGLVVIAYLSIVERGNIYFIPTTNLHRDNSTMQSRTFASVSMFNFWQNGFVSELTDIPSVESSVPRSRGLLQAEDLISDPVAETVHYFWCQEKTFQFQHYVSVLSVVKALEPLSIVIHYSSKPRTSLYYTWLGDLVEALPNIVLHDLGENHPCSLSQRLRTNTIQDTLSVKGGLYVGENVIVTAKMHDILKIPSKSDTETVQDIFIHRLNSHTLTDSVHSISGISCCSQTRYEGDPQHCLCVSVDGEIFPKDVWTSANQTARLVRQTAYGVSNTIWAKQDHSFLAPRIAHYVMYDSSKFAFSHYLSVLSCLHVAGLERVVLHGNMEPSSQWWKHLRVEENVTFSYTDPTNQIYGQNITQFPQHKSDITKFYVLLKYGGISLDPDVYWVNRIPDDILSYDAVLSKDWLKRLDWPDTLNIGVFIAKPNAQFLYNFLRAYRRNYRPRLYIYNGGCVPYKVYEKYPQSLHLDPHLQVLTFGPTYHPTWRSGYLHDSSGNMGNNSFDWRKDTLAVHVTDPKPASEFEGVVSLKRAKGMFADIGWYIIKKALKEDMFVPR